MNTVQAARFIPATGNRPAIKPLPQLPPAADAPIRKNSPRELSYFGSIGSTTTTRKPFALDFSTVRDVGNDFDPAVAAASNWATQLSKASNPTSVVGVYQTNKGSLLLAPAYQFDPNSKSRLGLPQLDVKLNVRPNDSNKGLLALVSPKTWSDLRIGHGLSSAVLTDLQELGSSTMKQTARADEALWQLQRLSEKSPSPSWAKSYSQKLDTVSELFDGVASEANRFVKSTGAVAGHDRSTKASLQGLSSSADRLVGYAKDFSAYNDFGNVSRVPESAVKEARSALWSIDSHVKEALSQAGVVPAQS